MECKWWITGFVSHPTPKFYARCLKDGDTMTIQKKTKQNKTGTKQKDGDTVPITMSQLVRNFLPRFSTDGAAGGPTTLRPAHQWFNLGPSFNAHAHE